MKVFCPLCREQRKDKSDRSVSVDLDKGVAYCHHCNQAFLKEKKKEECEKKTSYPAPSSTPLPLSILGGASAKRGISVQTLEKMRVGAAEEWMPQTKKKERCVCFNYYEEGRLVNTKFRDAEKHFKMVAGAEVIPYNIDGIKGVPECIITEGEIDALSFAEVGRTDVISVPTGANTNLRWMERFVKTHLEDKQVIYVAADADEKGEELGKALIRRLGAERCRTVSYPKGCKDANEVLVRFGGEAVNQLITSGVSQLPPVPCQLPPVPCQLPPVSCQLPEGVFTIRDVSAELRELFEKGMECGAETGWKNFDRYCTFETGRLLVITGVPGSGKSEFTDELVMRLNLRHKWKVAYFSPENMPLTYHLRKLMEKSTGQRFTKGHTQEANYVRGEAYLAGNFSFILPKENFTVNNILHTAEELVEKQGIKILVIDPFNRFEHQIPKGETETQYISAVLDRFTGFAVRNDCLVILIAHPRKMYKDRGLLNEPVPTLYDINGSAAFFNKCDFGLSVERDSKAEVTKIHIQKVRFRHLGENGEAPFIYNTVNGRYAPCDIDEQSGKGCDAQFDNTVWGEGLTI
jgi:twinkle protein